MPCWLIACPVHEPELGTTLGPVSGLCGQMGTQRGRALGAAVESLEQRALETVERSRALLELSGQRLCRYDAAVTRARERREREQAELGRAAAESGRKHAAAPPDPREAIERAAALREQGLTAMEAFAAIEEQLARTYEKLASAEQNPQVPWVSMASFTRARYKSLTRPVNRSIRLRSGGMRQSNPGWCSIVSFVPDPSGSKS